MAHRCRKVDFEARLRENPPRSLRVGRARYQRGATALERAPAKGVEPEVRPWLLGSGAQDYLSALGRSLAAQYRGHRQEIPNRCFGVPRWKPQAEGAVPLHPLVAILLPGLLLLAQSRDRHGSQRYPSFSHFPGISE